MDPLRKRRILLTGGNGFIGSRLTQALVARGDSVSCLVRPNANLSSLNGTSVTLLEGDVTDSVATLAQKFEGIHTVFHLAGIRRAANRDDFLRINTDGTRHIIEAMVQAHGQRLVLVSSLAASGPSLGGKMRTEAEPFAPSEWYGESKAEAERIALSYAKKLEVTICRPARILGPMDHENLTLFRLVQKGIVLKLAGPERRLSIVDVDDVVAMLLLLADRPQAVGQAFFCTSHETLTLEHLMCLIAQVLGVKARTVCLPQRLLQGLGEAADIISNATGKRLPLNRKLVQQLLAPGWACSVEKAKRLLGFEPTQTLKASVQRSAESYRAAGWL